MPLVTDCPSCGRKAQVPDSLLGQVVKCPGCAATFTAAPVVGGSAWPNQPPELPDAADYVQPQREYPLQRVAPQPGARPGKVQAIAIMTLVGGILATLNAVTFMGVLGISSMGICCLWPGPYYGLVVGIMAIVKGSQLLGEGAPNMAAPRGIAIMQIINIINFDVPNCVMGILTLVFLNEPETARYFRG
jgi:hypothetical protein